MPYVPKYGNVFMSSTENADARDEPMQLLRLSAVACVHTIGTYLLLVVLILPTAACHLAVYIKYKLTRLVGWSQVP